LRTATGVSTSATPAKNTAAALGRETIAAQTATTTISTIAFSRVSANPPIAIPSQKKVRNRRDRGARREEIFSPASAVSAVPVFVISHSARQMKNTSSVDFWSRPSKKIAGAYNASITPAARPTRVEKSRAPASASRTHDTDPITDWTIRTSSRLRPATA
jgi:hypothetical protein